MWFVEEPREGNGDSYLALRTVADNVTVADDSSILDTLTASQIDGLATNNVDTISATDGVLSWTADQYEQWLMRSLGLLLRPELRTTRDAGH